jgi:rhamnose transport system permease protein
MTTTWTQRRELGVLGATVVLVVVLAFCTRGYFTHENLLDLFLSIMPVMIIAIGMTMIIVTGHIDISIGSIFALCSIVAGLSAKAGLPPVVSSLVACSVGALCGGFNGALVSGLGIPSIVVTLATMVILRDGLRWKTQGSWVEGLPGSFQWFGLSSTSYVVLCFIVVVLLVLLAAFGLRYLPVGRTIFATGSNEAAARIAGINTRRVVFSVFTVTGALTGLAAVLNSVRFNQIPSNSGLGLEMKVIAAVAVGGAAITGGSASIAGTVLGVILLGCISSALTFLGISAYWEKAIQGGIILIAIAFDAIKLYRKPNANILST